MNTKHTPYTCNKSTNGTFWIDGPGTMTMRFDSELDAMHAAVMLNDAWNHGRRTGRQDIAIAQAVEQERMKKY